MVAALSLKGQAWPMHLRVTMVAPEKRAPPMGTLPAMQDAASGYRNVQAQPTSGAYHNPSAGSGGCQSQATQKHVPGIAPRKDAPPMGTLPALRDTINDRRSMQAQPTSGAHFHHSRALCGRQCRPSPEAVSFGARYPPGGALPSLPELAEKGFALRGLSSLSWPGATVAMRGGLARLCSVFLLLIA